MAQTPTRFQTLFISDSTEDLASQVLQQVLAGFGPVQVTPEAQAFHCLQGRAYDLLVIDAGAVTNAPQVVVQLHAADPDAKIVVFTASPHWKIAKAVIQAGANDYLSKFLTREDLLRALIQVLQEQAHFTT
jgi:DNA-binding NarL/FixJ family response regulator